MINLFNKKKRLEKKAMQERINKNKEDFMRIIKSVKRDGIEELIGYLENDTDFFTAPASTKYHNNFEGGLVDHSLKVYSLLAKKVTERPFSNFDWSLETITIVALLHDICKVNFYGTYQKNVKDENGRWNKETHYCIDDQFPYGHGEKSVAMIMKFIDLTEDEMMAIRWHMGFSERANMATIGNALNKYPLILAMMSSDIESTYLLEGTPKDVF